MTYVFHHELQTFNIRHFLEFSEGLRIIHGAVIHKNLHGDQIFGQVFQSLQNDQVIVKLFWLWRQKP